MEELAARETPDVAPVKGMVAVTITAPAFSRVDPTTWSRKAWAGRDEFGQVHILTQVGAKWMPVVLVAAVAGGNRVDTLLYRPVPLKKAVQDTFGQTRLMGL